MTRKAALLAGALALVIVATVAVVPAIVSARPAYEIPVVDDPGDDDLDSVNAQGWGGAPAATVPLSAAPSSVPAADDVSVERVSVQAARTDSRLYVRLSWPDVTSDVSTDRVRSFADAVAVQFPVNASARPPIAMGGTDNRVNVLYWTATGHTEALLAGGPGSTTRLPNAAVTSNASYSNGRWTVVLSRPLAPAGENLATVPDDADLDVAFAAWNGSNMERSGRKAVSEWYYLALGPGPSGPPYEVLLWAVAGVGIVITTLVTIEGVRRTRGSADGD